MKNIFKVRALMLIALLLAGVQAWAAGSGTKEDPAVLENGGEYTIGYAAWYGKFVVPEDVTTSNVVIEIVTPSARLDAFSDEALTEKVEMKSEGNFSPYTFTVAVPKGTAKGTTYYFYKEFDIQISNGTLKFSYGAPSELSLVSVTPAADGILSAASANVSLEFNKNIRIGGSSITTAVESKSVVANINGRFVSIDLKETLMELYGKGMKKGDALTVTLSDVKSADGTQSLGDVEVKYSMGSQPLKLVAQKNTPGNGMDTFYSWFQPIGDNGIVTLSFDGNLSTTILPKVSIGYGNVESETDYYYEELTPKVSGKDIVIDLRNKLRTGDAMGVKGYTTISLMITNVRDADGNYVYSEGSGSVGSFSFSYNYKEVDYEVYGEWTLGKNATIDNTSTIELWTREKGDGRLAFDAVRFAYVKNGASQHKDVLLSDIDVDAMGINEYTETTYTIPVPALDCDANSEVVVSLVNLSTPDGNTSAWESDLTVTYKVSDKTAVEGINAEKAAQTIYTLDGVRVKAAKKNNVYIINGKKMLEK